MPLVFSHVHITYGIPSDCKLLSKIVNPHESTSLGQANIRTERARAAKATSEFLQYVAATPELARMVKTLSVRAISLSPESADCADLVNALKTLTNLQSFGWRGNSPYIPEAAIHAIIESGAPLTEVVIPLWNPAANALSRLRNLQAIWIPIDLNIELPEERIRKPSSKENPRIIIQANAETLRVLSVHGVVSRWKVPVESLVNLTEFECIWFDGDFSFLASLFDQCAQLRSLTLGVGPEDLLRGGITAVLRSRPSSLPLLTAFKISLDSFNRSHAVALVRAMTAFLATKASLRRLDVNITGIDEKAHGLDLAGCPSVEVLQLLPSLPELEVLGLYFSRMFFTTADFDLLNESIPLGLTALFLNLKIRRVYDVRPGLFADFFTKRMRLQYLQIVDEGRTLVESLDELRTMCPRTVELIGYGNGHSNQMHWTVPTSAKSHMILLILRAFRKFCKMRKT
ncbi:hypothetical protein K466DRAFT_585074 [Polyporus arcularius HHB13444]|uniref:F-box domain-containing protein n=1 Tax=Polyporus arcularius HHB13444 TaxID=1314778 RepID=A0A5C3PKV7_9APHY|nr:hypothetical protein K466DRAFT_585074 [Polyporus arcularius HHB13444]